MFRFRSSRPEWNIRSPLLHDGRDYSVMLIAQKVGRIRSAGLNGRIIADRCRNFVNNILLPGSAVMGPHIGQHLAG